MNTLPQEHSLELPLSYVPGGEGNPPRIGVMLHAFHLDLLPQFRAHLEHLPAPADLHVSSDTEEKCAAAAAVFADWAKGGVAVRCVPNRGRDVAAKLIGLAAAHAGYDLVLHLHTKRSTHDSGLAGWRGYLLEALAGSPRNVAGILEIFRQLPRLGMLAPQQIEFLRPWIGWGENFALAADLAGRLGLELRPQGRLDFPAGSMFWARPAALAPLLGLGLDFADFPAETGQTDGTLAHAIERLFFLACEQAGFDWLKVAPAGLLHDQSGVVQVGSAHALRRFAARYGVRLGASPGGTGQKLAAARPARLAASPPPPLRATPILWRRALGEGSPAAPPPAIVAPADGGDAAMRAGFSGGAGLVLVLRRPGLLHPGAAAAAARMSAAQDGRALIELCSLPEPRPKPVRPGTLGLDAVDGPAVAVPRAIYEAFGAPPALADDAAWRDYSAQALEAGFSLRQCPPALFLPGSAPGRVPAPGQDVVDVLIRIADASELPRLTRAMFTVLGQTPALPLHVHLLAEGLAPAAVRRLRQLTEPLRPAAEGARVTLHAAPAGIRTDPAALLERGLALAAGRYLTALEVTDLLEAGAYARLLAGLRESDAVSATAPLPPQPVEWWGDSVVPLAADPPLSPPDGEALVCMLDRRALGGGRFAGAGESAGIRGLLRRIDSRHPGKSRWLDTAAGVRQNAI